MYSAYVSVCVRECVYVCTFPRPCVHADIRMYQCVCINVCVCVCVRARTCVRASVCHYLCVNVCACKCKCLFVSLNVFICLRVRLSVCV